MVIGNYISHYVNTPGGTFLIRHGEHLLGIFMHP